jgi:hypothetical protein
MTEETYVGSYKGHVIYHYRYIEGGVYGYDGIGKYFSTLAEVYAAIDKIEAPPPAPPVGPQAPSAPSEITLPWPWDWIAGPLNWLGSFFNWIVTQITTPISGIGLAISEISTSIGVSIAGIGTTIGSIGDGITNLPGVLGKSISDNLGTIFTKSSEASGTQAAALITSVVAGSPDYADAIKRPVTTWVNNYISGIEDLLKIEAETLKEPSGTKLLEQLEKTRRELVQFDINMFQVNAVVESGSLGQFEWVSQIDPMVLSKFGYSSIITADLMLPAQKGLLKRAEQVYNAKYQLEIPGYGDLQNMRMKEIIGQTEFEDMLKYHGYAPEWSRKMWDAHFIPPSLNDILTAWRRQIPVRYPKSDPATGTIVWIEKEKLDETDVRYLLESIDLDPRYIEIYETRKYVDPPLNITRFMFEEGVIKGDTVRELVALQGYRPEHVDYITKYITEFQERLWRRRYLVTLQGGYQKGVYTGEELNKAVLDAGYTQDVATWIKANADARKKIEESAVAVEEKPKLIGVGDLKKAYVRNMIDADKFRIDLQIRGYQTTDVDLLIKLLDEEKVVTSAGGEKVALSVPEIKAAWKYGKVTEDYVRIELQLRGLSLEEVEILISTWKAQLGVEGAEVG